MGNNESTEPFTSNMSNRRVLAGEFTIVNKYLLKVEKNAPGMAAVTTGLLSPAARETKPEPHTKRTCTHTDDAFTLTPTAPPPTLPVAWCDRTWWTAACGRPTCATRSSRTRAPCRACVSCPRSSRSCTRRCGRSSRRCEAFLPLPGASPRCLSPLPLPGSDPLPGERTDGPPCPAPTHRYLRAQPLSSPLLTLTASPLGLRPSTGDHRPGGGPRRVHPSPPGSLPHLSLLSPSPCR